MIFFCDLLTDCFSDKTFTIRLRSLRSTLLVEMMWVGAGFRNQNPHHAGVGFFGVGWVF